MGERSAEEIRHDIEAKRENISETVDLIGERIQERLDWRSYVGEHPFVALGVAAGVGLVLSGLFKRRPTPRERMLEALADSMEDTGYQVRNYLGEVLHRDNRIGTAVKGAATALATRVAIEFLKRKAIQTLVESEGVDLQERDQQPQSVSAEPATRPSLHATHYSSVG
jgi:hypothetical protein